MWTTSWRISQQGMEEAISGKARDTPETPQPAPGGLGRFGAGWGSGCLALAVEVGPSAPERSEGR
jgi:hypothetical protein